MPRRARSVGGAPRDVLAVEEDRARRAAAAGPSPRSAASILPTPLRPIRHIKRPVGTSSETPNRPGCGRRRHRGRRPRASSSTSPLGSDDARRSARRADRPRYTSRTRGSACTCSTVPSARTLPSWSTVTERAKRRRNAMSCSMTTTRVIAGQLLRAARRWPGAPGRSCRRPARRAAAAWAAARAACRSPATASGRG